MIIRNSRGDWIEMTDFRMEPMDHEDLFDDEDGSERNSPYFWFNYKGSAQLGGIRYRFDCDSSESKGSLSLLIDDMESAKVLFETNFEDAHNHPFALFMEQDIVYIGRELVDSVLVIELHLWALCREDGSACESTQIFWWESNPDRLEETVKSIKSDLESMKFQISNVKNKYRNR